MRLQAGKIGELVNAFLANHGGIHVGQEKPLAPGDDRLHHDINRQVAAHLAQPRLDDVELVVVFERLFEGDVDGDLVEQPVRLSR